MMQMMPMLWGCKRVPIFDNVATATYVNAITSNWINTNCLESHLGLWPEEFTTPAADGAWWVTDAPESKQFAGFYVERVTGMFGPAGVNRTTTALTGSRCGPVAAWRRMERQTRTVVIEGKAVGQTCCSVDYGLKALAAATRGCCSNGCTGGSVRTLQMLGGSCVCPQLPDQNPEQADDEKIANCARWVCLDGVSVVEGPTLTGTEQRAPCCGGSTTVRFRMVFEAVDPRLHYDEVPLTSMTINVDPDVCDNEAFCVSCPELASLENPNCPGLPTPSLPVAPSCSCAPILQQTQWSEFTVGDTWFDLEAQFRIRTAFNPVDKMVVRLWPKRADKPVGDPYYKACTACQSFGIAHIEASSTHVVGSGARVRTPGRGFRNANSRMFSPDSVTWAGCTPLSCGDWVMQVVWEYNNDGLSPNGTTIDVGVIESTP